MDFRRLEHFIAIAQFGSLTKASEALGVSEPSLSRQIRLLEKELDGSLFFRTGRGVRLTPAGTVFFEQASAIIEMGKRAKSAISEINSGSAGRIVVGIAPRIARVAMGPLIEAFQRKLPKASINVVEGLSVTLSDWLQLGRIEVAVLYNQRPLRSLDIEPLCKEELVLVGNAERGPLPKKLKFAEIGAYPLILPATPNIIRTSVDSACRQAQVQPNIVVEADTVQSILELVKRNLGYSIVPRGVVPKDKRQSQLVMCPVEAPRLTHYIALATSRKLPRTQLGLLTCQTIRELNLPKLLQA